MYQASIQVCLILAANCILAWASPGIKIGNIRFGREKTFDYSYENVISKHYSINIIANGKKDKCVQRITATGNGVGDVFTRPCSANGVIITTSSKVMIYGNPEKDTFSFFSDQDSTVVVNENGKCTRRKYKTVTSKTTPEISDMTEEECKQAREKVKILLDQEHKYLEVLTVSGNKGNEKRPDSTDSNFNPSSTSKPGSETAGKNNPADSKQGSKETSQNGVQVTETHSNAGNSGPYSVAKPSTSYSFSGQTLNADDLQTGGLDLFSLYSRVKDRL